MGVHGTDGGVKTEDLDAVRSELAAWRRAQPTSEERPGKQSARDQRVDLDLSPLRRARPLRAAPATAEEYTAALRSELIDLRAVETSHAR